ncbi:MAG: DUF6056 family protein [Prevotella sp.]|jgi:hypothetical protein|nr:DUF6056 family protein [Prevotella sp.]
MKQATPHQEKTSFQQFFRRINRIVIGDTLLQKILFGAVIALSFVLIYVLNVLHPLFGDDWMYSLTQTGRLNSFSDILHEQYRHYFEWGGRTVVHVIAQSLLLAGEEAGDLLNSLAFVLYILTVYYLANGSRALSIRLLIGVNMLAWFFQRTFGSSALWLTGSANYLWGTWLVLLFLIPYRKMVFQPERTKDSWLKCLPLFLSGVIAGWTNESTSVALILLLVVLLFYFRNTNGFIPKWSIAGCCGVILGCAMMLAAPGNRIRSEYLRVYEGRTSGIYSLDAISGGISRALWGIFDYMLPLIFIFFFILALFHTYGNNKGRRKVYSFAGGLLAAAIAGALAMSFSPVFPERAAFGLNTFIILGIGLLYAYLYRRNKMIKWLGNIALIFALLVFAPDYYNGYKELSHARKVMDARIAAVEKGKQNGQTDFVFTGEKLTANTRFLHYWEFSDKPEDSPNRWFTRYYDIQSVRFNEK